MATIINTIPQAAPLTASSSTLFTCLACLVAFKTANQQREHYRSDWHRYNLKRKVAELPSLSAEEFVERVQAQQAKQQQEADKNSYVAECTICSKKYSSENAYNNHLISSKHKENEAKRKTPTQMEKDSDEASFPASSETDINYQIHQYDKQFKAKVLAATSEQELMDILQLKMEQVPRLTERDCLFCHCRSKDLNSNLQHMTKAHSFFIPDIEYLIDVPGLISYLQEKIAVANVCLYCNGKGRTMHSLEAVRKHMLDKGHCKINLDDDEDDEDEENEYADYYNYEISWEDVGDDIDEEWEEVDANSNPDETIDVAVRNNADSITDDQIELTLPSGAKIGHRAYNRYWKQNLPTTRSKTSKDVVKSLLVQYRLLGHSTPQVQVAERMEKQKQAKLLALQRREVGVKIGRKGKNVFLMKHFRRQNPI